MATAKAEILLWKDLSLVQSEQILRCETVQERLDTIKDTCGVPKSGEKRDLITVDMYVYLVQFARKEKLSPAQMSVLFSLLKRVHQSCLSTPHDNMEETFSLFKEYLLCHSVNRPPFCVCLFSVEQVKSITDYFLSTYFKHYRLYKYAFTKKQRLNISFMYSDSLDEESPPPEPTEAVSGEDVDTEKELVKDGEPEVQGGDERDASGTESPLDPKEAELQKMVEGQLSEKLQQLQMTVTQDLEEYDKRMSEKISTFEASITKGKTKKK